MVKNIWLVPSAPRGDLPTPRQELYWVCPHLLVGPEDITVSYHVASLFTRVPIRKTVSLMGGYPSIGSRSDRRRIHGRFLGASAGSKALCRFHHPEKTFVNNVHRQKGMKRFQNYPESFRQNIRFTTAPPHWHRHSEQTWRFTGTETPSTRISTSTLAHTPTQQQAGPSVHHCKQAELWGKGSPLDDDLPKVMFRDNWYTLRQTSPAFHPPETTAWYRKLSTAVATLSCIRTIFNFTCRMLSRSLNALTCRPKKAHCSFALWRWSGTEESWSVQRPLLNVVWSTTHPPRQTVKSAVADKSLNWSGN